MEFRNHDPIDIEIATVLDEVSAVAAKGTIPYRSKVKKPNVPSSYFLQSDTSVTSIDNIGSHFPFQQSVHPQSHNYSQMPGPSRYPVPNYNPTEEFDGQCSSSSNVHGHGVMYRDDRPSESSEFEFKLTADSQSSIRTGTIPKTNMLPPMQVTSAGQTSPAGSPKKFGTGRLKPTCSPKLSSQPKQSTYPKRTVPFLNMYQAEKSGLATYYQMANISRRSSPENSQNYVQEYENGHLPESLDVFVPDVVEEAESHINELELNKLKANAEELRDMEGPTLAQSLKGSDESLDENEKSSCSTCLSIRRSLSKDSKASFSQSEDPPDPLAVQNAAVPFVNKVVNSASVICDAYSRGHRTPKFGSLRSIHRPDDEYKTSGLRIHDFKKGTSIDSQSDEIEPGDRRKTQLDDEYETNGIQDVQKRTSIDSRSDKIERGDKRKTIDSHTKILEDHEKRIRILERQIQEMQDFLKTKMVFDEMPPYDRNSRSKVSIWHADTKSLMERDKLGSRDAHWVREKTHKKEDESKRKKRSCWRKCGCLGAEQ